MAEQNESQKQTATYPRTLDSDPKQGFEPSIQEKLSCSTADVRSGQHGAQTGQSRVGEAIIQNGKKMGQSSQAA